MEKPTAIADACSGKISDEKNMLSDLGTAATGKYNHESHLSKRQFLGLCGMGACALVAWLTGLTRDLWAQAAKKGLIKTKHSSYYTPLKGGVIQCELCPRKCRVAKGERGFCEVRENRDGRLYSLVYGNPCIIHSDPIEKEPFFHVLPGSTVLTISTAGCNFRCKFCENWEISQASPESLYNYDMHPRVVVQKAHEMGARSIAYTYAEPSVFFEYMLDIALCAKKEGLLNIMHSNGFINPKPLRDLCSVLDAAHIDLKGFSNSFYKELCSGTLGPVLESLKILKQEGIHVEITNLLIPTKNDEMPLLRDMCLWIKKELGNETPVHFSRFYPLHKLTKLPSTPVAMLEKARTVALACGLNYVYIGKIPEHEAWNTFCPSCKNIIIQRTGYMIGEIHLSKGRCDYCGNPIPGIWI